MTKRYSSVSPVPYNFPNSDGSSGQVLSTNGTGTLSWATASGGGIAGPITSTVTAIPLWDNTAGTSLVDSNLLATEAGNIITVKGNTGKSLNIAAGLPATTTSAGNNITVSAGAGGSTSGAAGTISITGGSAVGANADGGSVTIAAGLSTGVGVTGSVILKGARGDVVANDGVIQIARNSNNSATRLQFVADNAAAINLKAPTSATAYSLILPTVQGASNSVLNNDGSGNLSWKFSGGFSATRSVAAADSPVLSDAGALIIVTAAGATDQTISPDTTTNFAIGSVVTWAVSGAGTPTIVAGSGVTLIPGPGLTLVSQGQGSMVQATKVAANTYIVYGSLV